MILTLSYFQCALKQFIWMVQDDISVDNAVAVIKHKDTSVDILQSNALLCDST